MRVTGLEFLDESGQKNLLREKRTHPCGRQTTGRTGIAAQPLDGLNRAVHFSMSYRGAGMLLIELVQHFRQMTRARADIQNRGGDAKDVINLAWVDQAHERIAHDHNVQVRG
jgi:hypothetical protein